MTSTIDDLAASLRAVGDLVAGVRSEQWHAPTPCPEWTVREVTNHLVAGSRLYVAILRGEAPVIGPDVLDPRSGDALGDDPAGAYRSAGDALLSESGRPGVLDQVFEVPVGAVPGVVAVQVRTVEELVHGWDVARATDQHPRFPEDTVERAVAFTREQLAAVPADRSPFAPPQSVADDAPALDRLVALVGRSPAPSP